jgi:hypothetical protein
VDLILKAANSAGTKGPGSDATIETPSGGINGARLIRASTFGILRATVVRQLDPSVVHEGERRDCSSVSQ